MAASSCASRAILVGRPAAGRAASGASRRRRAAGGAAARDSPDASSNRTRKPPSWFAISPSTGSPRPRTSRYPPSDLTRRPSSRTGASSLLARGRRRRARRPAGPRAASSAGSGWPCPAPATRYGLGVAAELQDLQVGGDQHARRGVTRRAGARSASRCRSAPRRGPRRGRAERRSRGRPRRCCSGKWRGRGLGPGLLARRSCAWRPPPRTGPDRSPIVSELPSQRKPLGLSA